MAHRYVNKCHMYLIYFRVSVLLQMSSECHVKKLGALISYLARLFICGCLEEAHIGYGEDGHWCCRHRDVLQMTSSQTHENLLQRASILRKLCVPCSENNFHFAFAFALPLGEINFYSCKIIQVNRKLGAPSGLRVGLYQVALTANESCRPP